MSESYDVFGWAFYGPLVFLPIEQRVFYFNILDFYNKLIFAIDVKNRIINDVKNRKNKQNKTN